MKKIFTYSIFLFLLQSTAFAQVTITPSLGWGTFVVGLTGVDNTLSIPDNGYTSVTVDFSGTNTNYNGTLTPNGGSWELIYDMGLLLDPSVTVTVYTDDGVTQDMGTGTFTLLAKPSWLNIGSAANVLVSANTINFDATLPILNSSANPMPSDVPGLDSRPYDLLNSNASIHVSYDYTQPASGSVLTNAAANFELNIFNQATLPYTYPLNVSQGLALDDNFNFAVKVSGTYNSQPFSIKFPAFRFPVGPIPIAIKVDGGVTFSASITGQLVFGDDGNGNFGFVDIGGEKTKVTAKINGEGFLRVSADALVASAGGSIIARGSIGGGFEYVSLPSSQTTPLFGLNLEIAGALDYKLGIGWFSKEGRIEKTFYSNTWGDQLRLPNGASLICDHVDAMGSYSATVSRSASFEPQDYYAQPSFSANNNKLYTVWLDYDAPDYKQKINFSTLDYGTSDFSAPIEVINNRDAISNPKVAILPSGAALITWTEPRYNSSNYDSTTQTLEDILKSQDIWASIYDNGNNTFLAPFRLTDDISNTDAIAEGNANIVMGKGNYGLVTWVNADLDNNTSDIYYSTVEESGTWNFGSAQMLNNLSGTNYNVNVAYYDSLLAIAAWIHDPDGTDSTFNSEIVYSEWNGTSWGANQVLVASDGMTNFDELSLDFNDVYGAIAFTSTHYNADGDFQKKITYAAWDDVNDQWGAVQSETSTEFYFSKPRVSVNKDGITALTYQAIELETDTLQPDEGVLFMELNNAQTNINSWLDYTDSTTLGDPGVYIADITSSFDNASNLFVITQEADDATGEAPANPVNGVRFGNNYLNLVLRGFTIGSGLAVNGTTEPTTGSTVTKVESYENDYNLLEAYPNPFRVYTDLKYTISKNSDVKIEVFNMMGQLVTTLFDGTLNSGIYSTTYEPKNIEGGIYLAKFTINGKTATKKLMLLK